MDRGILYGARVEAGEYPEVIVVEMEDIEIGEDAYEGIVPKNIKDGTTYMGLILKAYTKQSLFWKTVFFIRSMFQKTIPVHSYIRDIGIGMRLRYENNMEKK